MRQFGAEEPGRTAKRESSSKMAALKTRMEMAIAAHTCHPVNQMFVGVSANADSGRWAR